MGGGHEGLGVDLDLEWLSMTLSLASVVLMLYSRGFQLIRLHNFCCLNTKFIPESTIYQRSTSLSMKKPVTGCMCKGMPKFDTAKENFDCIADRVHY